MWFTEDPWPPILMLAAAAVFLFGSWVTRPRNGTLIAGVAALAGCVAIFLVERAIVTDGERIEQHVLDMADAVRRGDGPRAVSFVSPQAPLLQGTILGAMQFVTVEDDLRITDMRVDLRAGGTQAIAHFRANATIRVGGALSYHGHHPSRWELTWQRVGDDWRVIEIHRLHVVNGDRIEILQRAE